MAVATPLARSGGPGPAPGRGRRSRTERALPFLLLLPAAIALGLVSIYPIYAGVRASLTTYLFGRPIAGAGLKNYTDTWHDPVFWQAMAVTLKFVLITVAAETVLGLGLALLVAVIWRLIYESETGFVNPLFSALGLGAPNVLSHPASAFYGLVLVDVWEWTPLLFLIF